MATDLATAEHVMPEADAHRLTERIRYAAMSVRDGVEKLQRLVSEAQEGNAHLALGYASWTAYIADVMGDEPLRLPRDKRREVVAWLAGEGMSTRAIAPVVGQSHMTVSRDLAGVTDVTPPSAPSAPSPDEPEIDLSRVDKTTGEIHETPQGGATGPTEVETSPVAAAPRPAVTGVDGKTYTRPEPRQPSAPKRRPLTDVAREVGLDLRKVAERVERLTNDDRFTANKNEVAAHLRHHLAYAVEVLADLDNSINS